MEGRPTTNSSSLLSRSSGAADLGNATSLEERVRIINDFLEGKEIVIYIPKTNNLGMQAAAFDVIRLLITRFAVNTIRIVFSPTTYEFVKGQGFIDVPMWPKIRLFLPELVVNEPDATKSIPGFPFPYNNRNLILQNRDGFSDFVIEEIPNIDINPNRICICGALDETDNNAKVEFIQLMGGKFNLLQYFNVRDCLILQPFHRSVSENHVRGPLNKYFIQHPDNPDGTTNIEEFDLEREIEDFVDLSYYIDLPETPQDGALETILPQLSGLVKKVLNEEIHLLPIYFSQRRTLEPFNIILFNLILGLIEARQQSNELNKPIVILLLNHVADEVLFDALESTLAGKVQKVIFNERNDKYEIDTKTAPYHRLSAFLLKTPLKSSLQKVKIIRTTGEISGLEDQLADNQSFTLLGLRNIHGKSIEQKIFQYLFSLSTLPCAFEGTGTTSFVLSRGLPFCQLLSADFIEFENQKKAARPTASRASEETFIKLKAYLENLLIDPVGTTSDPDNKITARIQEFLPFIVTDSSIAPLFRVEKLNDFHWKIIDIENGGFIEIKIEDTGKPTNPYLIRLAEQTATFFERTLISAYYPFCAQYRPAVFFLHQVSVSLMRDLSFWERWLQNTEEVLPCTNIAQYIVSSILARKEGVDPERPWLQLYLNHLKAFYSDIKNDKTLKALFWLAERYRNN